MNSRFARAVLVLLMLIVAACGKGDSPPGAPTGVTATAGDSRVVVSWAGDGGATYWIFSAADPTINLQNWTALTGAKVLTGAISPPMRSGRSKSHGRKMLFAINHSFVINPTLTFL